MKKASKGTKNQKMTRIRGEGKDQGLKIKIEEFQMNREFHTPAKQRMLKNCTEVATENLPERKLSLMKSRRRT